METYNLVSLGGIFILLAFAWLCSSNKRKLNWRVIFWGITLQLAFAFFIFIVPAGSKVFLFLNGLVIKLLDSASAGSRFVFGRLALAPGTIGDNGESSLGFILAFQALTGIVFFASLMGILYYIGFMGKVVSAFSRIFTKLMKISGAESLCVSSNIFVGIESTLTIKPYLARMTRSELTTVLTAGMATVASNVMVMYVAMLLDVFPSIAGHLISASLLSAPAALVMSKILIPETESPVTLGVNIKPESSKEDNVLTAIIKDANAGVKLVVGIVALLLAFIGLVSLADLILGTVGSGINSLLGIDFEWSLKSLLGLVFYPFALVIGIPVGDCTEIARIIGERVIVTEVTAYQDLAVLIKQGVLQHPRSVVICTYVLCGFAHIASLAVFTGGVAALAPGRTKDLSRLGPRALLAATLACLMTGCMAGLFFNNSSILFLKPM